MTKICDMKSEIKDLEIIMDEAITIQVLNFLDYSFAQFFGIMSLKARKKEISYIWEPCQSSKRRRNLNEKSG